VEVCFFVTSLDCLQQMLENRPICKTGKEQGTVPAPAVAATDAAFCSDLPSPSSLHQFLSQPSRLRRPSVRPRAPASPPLSPARSSRRSSAVRGALPLARGAPLHHSGFRARSNPEALTCERRPDLSAGGRAATGDRPSPSSSARTDAAGPHPRRHLLPRHEHRLLPQRAGPSPSLSLSRSSGASC
jgi:hypothetical protein